MPKTKKIDVKAKRVSPVWSIRIILYAVQTALY